MSDQTPNPAEDRADVVVRPPALWFLLLAAGYGLSWLVPLRFVPAPWANIWIGAGVFGIGLAIAIWSFRQFKNFRGDLDTHSPSSALVDSGPFAISRNPIYCGMFLGLIGAAIAADTLWIIAGLVIWYPIMRHGVIGREEAYLERHFGAPYLDYKSRVRRWI
jgi:protein-S-isoprenylcysteine O-methyltransferase Ste14